MQAGFLFALVFKATVVLTLTWLVADAMSRASAAARSSVWASGLAFLVALPLLMTVVPSWSLRLIPPTATSEVASGRSAPGATTPAVRHTTDRLETRGRLTLTPPAAVVRAVTVVWPAAAAGWLIGCAVLFLRMAAAAFSVRRLQREAIPLQDAEWSAAIRQGCVDLGIRTPPRALVSSRIGVPAVSGVVSPVLLLPADCLTWSPSCRRVVVLHELAHLKRRDCLVQWLAECACALYWFHPLAHLAAARLGEEREHACDDVVLAAGTASTTYADHLIDLVRAGVSAPRLATVAFGTRSRLNDRIHAILADDRWRTEPRARTVVIGVLAGSVALTALGSVRLTAQPASAALMAQHGGVVTRRISAEHRQRAGDALAAALGDDNDDVRAVAGEAVQSIRSLIDGGTEVTVRCGGNCTNWPGALAMGESLVQRFLNPSFQDAVDQLGSDDVEVRRAAVWNVWPRTERGAAALTRALVDDDRQVRNGAAIRLDSVHAASAVPNWIVLLDDADPMLRERAAISLGVLGDPRAIEPLGQALRDQEADVRLSAAKALAAIALGPPDARDKVEASPVMRAVRPAVVGQERQVYRSGDAGVTLPEVVKQVRPEYTPAALQARIQGRVVLEAVVEPDGSVGNVRVLESLDQQYGLDAEAVSAARQSEFKPGRLEGKPVAVAISLEFRFALR
jgi:TonB family protein